VGLFLWFWASGSVFADERPWLSRLDFKREVPSHGVLTIGLTDKQDALDMRQKGRQLHIDLMGTQIKDDMLYVLDVTDFGTLVKTVETFRKPQSTQLILSMTDAFDYDYKVVGKKVRVIISPKPKPTEKINQIEYQGKPISINFQDVPVRNVLQLIAEYNDFNLVVSDTVTGNLTLRLDDVPWQQVLDIILQSKDLDKRVEGSVVLIAPKAELALSEQKDLEAKRAEEELSLLRSEIITVNYAKADELAELLKAGDGVGMLSSRGSIHVDSRTNALIVQDLDHSIENIKQLVTLLDIPVKQVEIEARIVTVNEGDLEELGISWGLERNQDESNWDASDPDFNFNFDGASTNVALNFASLGGYALDLELSALQNENKAEIISSPRLITTNKQAAYIEQGTEVPYLASSSSGAVSVEFKKAVLSLMVTPQITPDDKLILDLVVTQDDIGQKVNTGTGEVVSIDTQRIGTQVLVNNGETVVLGGIYQHKVNNAVSKVPLLGDIPGIGALFRHKTQSFAKKELLIFVTPKIVFQ
jgi:type IV pilus assembly protein PilQ